MGFEESQNNVATPQADFSVNSPQVIYVAQTPEGYPQYFIPQNYAVPQSFENQIPVSPTPHHDYHVHIDSFIPNPADIAEIRLRRSLICFKVTLIVALIYNIFGFMFFPEFLLLNSLILLSIIVGTIGAAAKSPCFLVLYSFAAFFFAGYFTYFFIMFFVYFLPSFVMWWTAFSALSLVRSVNYHKRIQRLMSSTA